jgi:spore coat polysaccharide biosynthesis protein SpsF (cytidylyltransferase family)
VASGRLERAQTVERWQPAIHLTPYMRLFHPKRYKLSFVESQNLPDIPDNRLSIGGDHVHLLT